MKKSMGVIFAISVYALVLGGCATSGDLEKVRARSMETEAKADQALKAAEDANAAAAKAAEAVTRAEVAAKEADERARIAEEKAKNAEATFEKSMRK